MCWQVYGEKRTNRIKNPSKRIALAGIAPHLGITPDPLFPKQMRYQAALCPEPWRFFKAHKLI